MSVVQEETKATAWIEAEAAAIAEGRAEAATEAAEVEAAAAVAGQSEAAAPAAGPLPLLVAGGTTSSVFPEVAMDAGVAQANRDPPRVQS